MKHLKILCAILGLMIISTGAQAAKPVPSLFAGKWKVNSELSTDLTPWPEVALNITQDADKILIARHLSWGKRQFDESMPLDLTKKDNVIAVEMWADNRNLAAFIGDDHIKHVQAQLVDGGRALILDTRLTLATQQGNREVFIHSQLTISTNGKRLTWIELRSTRTRPIIYVFDRI